MKKGLEEKPQNLISSKVPEVWETEDEKLQTVDSLRRYFKEFARKNYRDYPYINKNTGWKIRISDQGIGEIRKFRKREHIFLIRILDEILENSIFVCTVPDNKNKPGIENVSYFDCKCIINGKEYLTRLTIKKALNDEVRFFYYHKTNKHIKKAKSQKPYSGTLLA